MEISWYCDSCRLVDWGNALIEQLHDVHGWCDGEGSLTLLQATGRISRILGPLWHPHLLDTRVPWLSYPELGSMNHEPHAKLGT
jgi:hypothetical protein